MVSLSSLKCPTFRTSSSKLMTSTFLPTLPTRLPRVESSSMSRATLLWPAIPSRAQRGLEEIVFSIVNECNFELAKSAPIDERVPFLESPTKKAIDLICEMKQRPRLIKTHLPLSLLPVGIEKHCTVSQSF